MAESFKQQQNMNMKSVASPHQEREERIRALWKASDTFKKSISKSNPKGEYTFYDGPPFATGLPHYGHILAGTIKDVIPRFKTMQGYRVRRRWGWDCHGLPVENLVEKELGLKSKKDIIDYGIGKFNAKAQESVMRYADEWREIIPRLGRWVDMDDDYRTMDATYTESVWWIFKQLFDKGLIYEGFKSMNLCPHCGTTLSNFEVAQGYKDITDISTYVKFEILNSKLETNSKSKDPNSKTYILAWTTTPWTLPGNVALAVNPEIEYVKIRLITEEGKSEDENKGTCFILAKPRLGALKEKKYELVESFKGSALVGLSYKPVFPYYAKDSSLTNHENAWKIYTAPFVTTEDGTGVVHIAPAFGADDYELSVKEKLPFIQHVNTDGTFKAEVTDFAGMNVKPKDTDEDKNAHQKADIEIIKWLAHNGSLFEKEKLIHSYPHCWRCETPLLNYATSSWFVKVTDIKDTLVAENKKITWVPPEVGSARFGNWLEGARDWAISRSRFWGAPIPVWREQTKESSLDKLGTSKEGKTERYHVIGSLDDLKKYSKVRNTYHIIRHGESENNILGVLNSDQTKNYHLTEKGKQEVTASAKNLVGKVDLIYTSPLVRARETAEIVAKSLGIESASVIVDERLSEVHMGELEGHKSEEFGNLFPTREEFFVHSVKGVESRIALKRRVGAFLEEIDKKHQGKNILIVSHDSPLWMLQSAAGALDNTQSLELKPKGMYFLDNAEVRKIEYAPLPHNADYTLDLHRPFIDTIELTTPEGNKLVRVPDVFDCWFESGSMPYGESHYPFEKDSAFEPKSGLFHKSRGYPADFIAEGLDQTRGWFYSMLVLGVALFGKAPYKKVIVNGLVLAEDGQKMSKSKQNYPDPMVVVNKYGADSLRYYLLSSPVVHGQDLRFSEKGVDEVTKKLVNRLLNVVSFYEMYGSMKHEARSTKQEQSQNILDQWVVSRLNEVITTVTAGLEAGELDRAARPLMDFTDDLSTWYLRRSRDRFKGNDESDKRAALNTTQFVLFEMAKLLAPFMPFLAEDIYQRVGGAAVPNVESVHLDGWPVPGKIDPTVLTNMSIVRELSSKGLEARMVAKINVRQPLRTLRTRIAAELSSQLVDLVKDEVNVKEVSFAAPIEVDVVLDTVITPDLKEEGMVRELIRVIQDLRKAKGLSVNDSATITVETTGEGQAFLTKNKNQLMTTCTVTDINFGTVTTEPIIVGDISFKVSL